MQHSTNPRSLDPTEWPLVDRIVHCVGGSQLHNKIHSNVVELHPSKDVVNTFVISKYPDLFSVARKESLQAIGIEFVRSIDEFEGIEPSEWRGLNPHPSDLWQSHEVTQKWSQIAFHAMKSDQMALAQRARHISTQLQIATHRVHELSIAHSRYLRWKIQRDRIRIGKWSSGPWSENIYFATHSILQDLYILKDYLAAFAAFNLMGRTLTSLTELRAACLKESTFAEITDHFIDRTTGDKVDWIDDLESYRNLIVHNVPIIESNGRINVYDFEYDTGLGVKFAGVELRVPTNVKEVKRQFSTTTRFNTLADWHVATSQNTSDSGANVQSMTLGYYRSLCRIASELIKYSPVQPRVITFEDIGAKNFSPH